MKRVLARLLVISAATGGMAFQLMASSSRSRSPTQMKASASEIISRRALLEKARCAEHVLTCRGILTTCAHVATRHGCACLD
ncbi:unnamed protein product [Ectocarpus sp. CCAP 1310/34]|nr:unnamed protein product [Ectocarpus sp. CCAP 1310/34]